MTREILRVSNKNHGCEYPKHEVKNWCFLVLRACCEGGDCPHFAAHCRTWKAEYFTQADSASCKTTLQNPALCPSFTFSFSQWDFGTRVWAWSCWRVSAQKTRLMKIHITEMFSYKLLVLLIGEAYRPIGSPSDEWGLKPVTSQRPGFWTYFCCVVTRWRTISFLTYYH